MSNRFMAVPFRSGARVALLALWLTACGLTDVDAPDVVQPSQVLTPDGAKALRVAAVSQLYGDVVLGVDGVPQEGGFASDELIAGNASGPDQALDARRLVGDPQIFYVSMHQVRVTLLQAIAAFQKYPSLLPQAYIGEMFALIGVVETYFGETFCSGVPLSTYANGVPQYGNSLTTEQMFQHAIADFDSALAYAADSTRFLDLARVGRARALLDLGRFDDAASAVALVPTNFLRNAEAAAFSLQANGIGLNQSNLYDGVADKKGVNGLDYISAADPRIQVQLVGPAADGTPVYLYVPYANGDSPVPIASGIEARLIEAEAELHNGAVAQWLATLNALRTDGTQTAGVYNPGTGGVAGLAPLVDPGTADTRVSLMFRERAFWLFFTGHRLGDLRRLVRQYGRPQNTVFPVGPYKTNGVFGDAVNLPIPSGENPNPNFHGCLDRNP